MNDTEGATLNRSDPYEETFQSPAVQIYYWTATLLIQTAGNYLLATMIYSIGQDPVALLTERLLALIVEVVLVLNGLQLITALRYLFGPLPSALCWSVDAAAACASLCLVLVSDEIILLKVLFASVWRNVGELNDDFFVLFNRVLMFVFAVLYAGELYLSQRTLRMPYCVVCAGSDPANLETNGLTFMTVLFAVSILASLVAGAFIAKERVGLNRLQESTRDSRGLPRVSGSHPSLQYLRGHCILLTSVFCGIAVFALLSKAIKHGTLDSIPTAMLVPTYHTIGNIQLSFGLPLMILSNGGKSGSRYKKHLQSVFAIEKT